MPCCRLPSLLRCLPERAQPAVGVFAMSLISFSHAPFLCVGNLIPYIASYVKFVDHDPVSIASLGWIGGLSMASVGVFVFPGGWLQKKSGSSRLVLLIGCAVSTAGVGVTAVAMKAGIWAAALSFGVVVGAGYGITFSPRFGVAMQWMPSHAGLASGMVTAGLGVGAFVFNYLATMYVNPKNLPPMVKKGSVAFFTEKDILDRTPTMFIIMAGVCAVLQIIALVIADDPPKDDEASERQSLIRSTTSADSPDLSARSSLSRETSDEHERIRIRTPSISTEELLIDRHQLSAEVPSTVMNQNPLDARPDFTLTEALASGTFYNLWLASMLCTTVNAFFNTYYKVCGQGFIMNDHFLALTGSFSVMLSAVGRLFWGYLADKFSYRTALVLITGITAIFVFTMTLTLHNGKAMYFIWIVAVFFTIPGSFALFPMATLQYFGGTNFGHIFGAISSSIIVSGLLSAFVASPLLDYIHFSGVFLLIGFAAVAAMILGLTIGQSCGDGMKEKLSVVRVTTD